MRKRTINWELIKCRHKAEIFLNIISVLFTFSVASFLIYADGRRTLRKIVVSTISAAANVNETVADVILKLKFVVFTLLIIILYIVINKKNNYTCAKAMAYDVKVTRKQFPEFIDWKNEYRKKLGLKKDFNIYVTTRDVNFSLFFASIYVTNIYINAEQILQAEETGNYQGIRFTIAHKLAKNYLGYANIWFQIFTFLARCIPYFSHMYERSMTYSADRIAQYLLEDDGIAEAICMLNNNPYFYPFVNVKEDITNKTKKYTFKEKRYLFYVNLGSKEPLLPYRLSAILDTKKRDGKLFWYRFNK